MSQHPAEPAAFKALEQLAPTSIPGAEHLVYGSCRLVRCFFFVRRRRALG